MNKDIIWKTPAEFQACLDKTALENIIILVEDIHPSYEVFVLTKCNGKWWVDNPLNNFSYGDWKASDYLRIAVVDF